MICIRLARTGTRYDTSLGEGREHTALDCRSYWFENFCETFHELMDDGGLNTEELARQGWKAGAEIEEGE